MLLEIQVMPNPSGTPDDRYHNVDAAIAVIQASGLKYEVHAMGTVVEGSPDEIWSLARQAHEAALAAGADRVSSAIKVSQAADPVMQSTIASLTGKFRA